jgi:hypothetical protein
VRAHDAHNGRAIPRPGNRGSQRDDRVKVKTESNTTLSAARK